MAIILVTGGAGFIGSTLVRQVLQQSSDDVVVLDALTYAGNVANLNGLAERYPGRYRFVKGDVANPADVQRAMDGIGGEMSIVHCAAESHVDRSIADAMPFVRTNVTGTMVLLEALKGLGKGRLLLMSTDEVYGDLEPHDTPFTEDTPLRPSSPYSASKASADMLALAYHRTYGLDVVVTRCGNNYGPYQFPEKFLPVTMLAAMEGRRIPVYGDGLQVRDWIHVEDHCSGVLAALRHGAAGRVYNFGAANERRNIDMVGMVLRELNAPESLIEYVTDRPGHDRRYAVDATRAQSELAWSPRIEFHDGLRDTLAWYQQQASWVRDIRSGEYRVHNERYVQ